MFYFFYFRHNEITIAVMFLKRCFYALVDTNFWKIAQFQNNIFIDEF